MSLSLILMWHDSTANVLPDFLAMSSRTVPEPKQRHVFGQPVHQPKHGLTTCVA